MESTSQGYLYATVGICIGIGKGKLSNQAFGDSFD
jgi:hypothetical protein